MLMKFYCKNFKNFEEEICLDFSKHRDYEYNQQFIKNDLINKCLIYGENGVGKSNFGLAIMDITTHLTDKQKRYEPYGLFANLNSVEDVVSFIYQFKFNEDIIMYSYKKDSNGKLLVEEIKKNDYIVFKYNYITNNYTNKIKSLEEINLKNRNNDNSVVRYLSNLEINSDKNSPLYQIVDFAYHMLWFRSLKFNEYMGAFKGSDDMNDFIIKENLIEDFQHFLQETGQNFDLTIKTDLTGKSILCVKYNKREVPFQDIISTGTSSLWLFYYWMKKNDKITFLFLDEFDSFYHYNLSKYILNYINKCDSFQSILTTQNIFLLDNYLMRPDCYFEIKNGKINSYAFMTNKVIRQTHNLQRMKLGNEFE